MSTLPRADTLLFERDGKRARVRLRPVFTSNSGDVGREMAIAGVGIAASPSFLMEAAVADGRLKQVLGEWTVMPGPKLWAVYPEKRFLPAKVRLLVDALREAFGGGSLA